MLLIDILSIFQANYFFTVIQIGIRKIDYSLGKVLEVSTDILNIFYHSKNELIVTDNLTWDECCKINVGGVLPRAAWHMQVFLLWWSSQFIIIIIMSLCTVSPDFSYQEAEWVVQDLRNMLSLPHHSASEFPT